MSLHEAVRRGKIEHVRTLINQGIDVNTQDNDGMTALHRAVEVCCHVESDDSKEILKLISAKADFSIKNNEDQTALQCAIDEGCDFDLSKTLIDAGADANSQGIQNGFTVLHLAVKKINEYRHTSLIEDLASIVKNISCADIEKKDRKGFTALQYALDEDDKFTVTKILIDAGADVNTHSEKWHQTALHLAVKKNDMTMIEYLLSRNADVNKTDKNKKTALHILAYENEGETHLNTADILLKNKAINFDAVDEDRRTPFHYLVRRGSINIVQLFLNFKVDVNTQDIWGETPLFEAVRNGNFEVLQLLINNGLDVNYVNPKNRSRPLHAAFFGSNDDIHQKVVEILLKNGANVNVQDHRGETPFHSFAYSGDMRIAELFFNSKADFNVRNNEGELPLYNAVINRKVKVAQFLIDNGSDVNYINNEGLTLLHRLCCCSTNNIKIMECLLKNSANPNIVEKSKEHTPLMAMLYYYFHLPSSKKREKIMNIVKQRLNLLLEHGADVNKIDLDKSNVLEYSDFENLWKIILEHLAKLDLKNLPISLSLTNIIRNNVKYNKYFKHCKIMVLRK